jgi:nicotinamidase-related amidase
MDALIIVDMQVGLLNGSPKHDLRGVVERINAISERVRREGGAVIWIRHCGDDGDQFDRHASGWEFLPELARDPNDLVVEKTLNDPYVGTSLDATVEQLRPSRIIIAGWATDFCVDATVRSTVSRDYDVIAIGDAHTLSDRPHLPATAVITHHNWLWSELISNRTIRVISTREFLAEDAQPRDCR